MMRIAVLAAPLLLRLLGAQEPAHPAETTHAGLVVQNLAPYPRSEWVQVSVPFSEGAVKDLPDLHVDGRPTVWEPFGARWPDGSLRQALCLFRADLPRVGEIAATLVDGKGEGVPEFQAALPEHAIEIVAVIDGKRFAAKLPEVEVLAANAARRVTVMRGRVGDSGLVAEATLEQYSGQTHAWFGIGVFFSDPHKDALQLQIDKLCVESTGLAFVPRHAALLGMRTELTDSGCRTVLLENAHLGDGQGIRRVGTLVPPLRDKGDEESRRIDDTIRAAIVCRPLGATDWTRSLAFGPYGAVPPPPPWINGPDAVRNAMARRHADFAEFVRNAKPDPFRAERHGLDTQAHRAGDQPDFGLCAMDPVAATGRPSFLFEVEWSVLQEGCRPVHFFEIDGRPYTSREHPKLVMLNGRPHWHQGTSPDRLGKPYPPEKFDSHDWSGIDNEHFSNNYICAYYLLTAEPQVLLELRNETQAWIAENTLDPEFFTSNSGTARAAGRTILSACWLWLCNPDDELKQRIRDRMHQTMIRCWCGGKWPPEYVRPYDVKGADIRYFPGPEFTWAPWEDSLTASGFGAYVALFRDRSAEIQGLVDGLALNLLRYAWRVNADGRAEIAYAMKYYDGKPYTKEMYDDPMVVKWPSSSFAVWALGSLVLARQAAARQGLEDLVQRADDLLGRLQHQREVPRDGFWDHYSMWSAIR